MPDGFIGNFARRYLTEVSDAHAQATTRSASVMPPNTPQNEMPKAMRLPFSPEEATQGSFFTGKGNSSNIVNDQRKCEELTQKISKTDDKIGECIYRVAEEVERLCRTSFLLPNVVPRCLNITSSSKSSMSEFRELAEEAAGLMRKYTREISEVR